MRILVLNHCGQQTKMKTKCVRKSYKTVLFYTSLNLICDLCGTACRSKSELEDHLKKTHKEESFVFDRCIICKMTTLDTKTLPVYCISSLTV